jgi:hypothetical protein
VVEKSYTSNVSLGKMVKPLLKKIELTKKVILHVKDERLNLGIVESSIFYVVSCELLDLLNLYVSICFECLMLNVVNIYVWGKINKEWNKIFEGHSSSFVDG